MEAIKPQKTTKKKQNSGNMEQIIVIRIHKIKYEKSL